MHQRMESHPVGRRILQDKPRITDDIFNSLSALPEGTFGYFWLYIGNSTTTGWVGSILDLLSAQWSSTSPISSMPMFSRDTNRSMISSILCSAKGYQWIRNSLSNGLKWDSSDCPQPLLPVWYHLLSVPDLISLKSAKSFELLTKLNLLWIFTSKKSSPNQQ